VNQRTKSALAVVVVAVLVVWSVAANTHSGPSQQQPVQHAAAKHPPRPTIHYTRSERLLIDSVDIAAGKAMQAAASPSGLYERRTSQEWCATALDAEQTLVRDHSLAWSSKVDHARDGESRKFQQAAQACG
jgi:hypothetical protein